MGPTAMGEGPGPNPLWDPFGLWRALPRPNGPWPPATVPPGMPPVPTALELFLQAVRLRLVGRRVRFKVGGVPVAFDLDDIVLPADSLLMAAGQADKVTVTASDLEYGAHRFAAARADLHNVHTQSGREPRLVSAPIDLHLTLSGDYVSEQVSARVPWLRVQITESGEIQARLRSRPRWGWVPVSVEADGHRLRVRPRALVLRGRSWRLPARMPPRDLPLSLPPDVRLAGVRVLAESVELRFRADERHVDFRAAMSFLSRGRGRASAP